MQFATIQHYTRLALGYERYKEEMRSKGNVGTINDYADLVGRSYRQVTSALKWRRTQVYEGSSDILEEHIASPREHIKQYERELSALLKAIRDKRKEARRILSDINREAKEEPGGKAAKTPPELILGLLKTVGVSSDDAKSIAALAGTILQYKTRLMELEGIYKQMVNPSLPGSAPKQITYRAVPADPEAEKYEHGGNGDS